MRLERLVAERFAMPVPSPEEYRIVQQIGDQISPIADIECNDVVTGSQPDLILSTGTPVVITGVPQAAQQSLVIQILIADDPATQQQIIARASHQPVATFPAHQQTGITAGHWGIYRWKQVHIDGRSGWGIKRGQDIVARTARQPAESAQDIGTLMGIHARRPVGLHHQLVD